MVRSLLFFLLLSSGGLFGAGGSGDISVDAGLGSLSVSIDLVLSVLLDEVGKILNGAGSLVVNRGVLGASWEELNGGEALDLIRYVVSGSIDLGDGHLGGEVGVVRVESAENIPFRSKTGDELVFFFFFFHPKTKVIRQGRLTPCSVRTMGRRTRQEHPCRC